MIRFAAAGSDVVPDPAPPVPAAVRCGQVLVTSTRLVNDMSDCPADGLVVGASGIVVDLGGHTVDGTGLGTGIQVDGHSAVTVRNGTVQEFDHGVQIGSESARDVVEGLTLRQNQIGAVELFDARPGTEIRGNTVDR